MLSLFLSIILLILFILLVLCILLLLLIIVYIIVIYTIITYITFTYIIIYIIATSTINIIATTVRGFYGWMIIASRSITIFRGLTSHTEQRYYHLIFLL